VRVLTPAKVNLHLGVHTQLDARGYHRVDSVMAALDLCDEVLVRPHDELLVEVSPDVGMPAERNNVGRATTCLAEALGREPLVHVQVRRAIPMRAGLGGSSSDAGGTLRALCRLWGVDTTDERVVKVARSIGADVPFFLDPRPSYLAGAGDVLVETYPALPELPVVLVKPADGVLTVEAYADFDREPPACGDLEGMRRALREGDADRMVELLANNLDEVACRLLPIAAEARAWLVACDGVRNVLVSGSGSCVFAVCESAADVQRIAGEASGRGWWSYATRFAAPQQAEVC
jgi:4-diphosphocytidyl-2-C-methyl-D-erythritol kinase